MLTPASSLICRLSSPISPPPACSTRFLRRSTLPRTTSPFPPRLTRRLLPARTTLSPLPTYHYDPTGAAAFLAPLFRPRRRFSAAPARTRETTGRGSAEALTSDDTQTQPGRKGRTPFRCPACLACVISSLSALSVRENSPPTCPIPPPPRGSFTRI
jgi:hypothetical protein